MLEPASKPSTNDKSDLDIARLMEAYGLTNTSPQTSLKKRVQIDDISIGFENTVNSLYKEFTLPICVLHGAPILHDVQTEWHTIEQIEPVSTFIGDHCIQMEANILTEWCIDRFMQANTVHLIEIDAITYTSNTK